MGSRDVVGVRVTYAITGGRVEDCEEGESNMGACGMVIFGTSVCVCV